MAMTDLRSQKMLWAGNILPVASLVTSRITQGAYSFLPDLTENQIFDQVEFALRQGWGIMIEYTDDPHPRNAFWEMWGAPFFGLEEEDSDLVVMELNQCVDTLKRYGHTQPMTTPSSLSSTSSNYYVKLSCFDNTRGVESCALSFIIARPSVEARFRLVRQDWKDGE